MPVRALPAQATLRALPARVTSRALPALAAAVLLAACGSGGAPPEQEDTATSARPGPERGDGVDKYPLGTGTHTVESDPGWVYFRTPEGRGCGIGPIGRIVGCDLVPRDAPAGTGQTAIEGNRPAAYQPGPTPTFTRDVDVLPAGHRLTNGATRCAVEAPGTVHCETAGGAHGFVVSSGSGVLW